MRGTLAERTDVGPPASSTAPPGSMPARSTGGTHRSAVVLLALAGLAVLCWGFSILCQWALVPGLAQDRLSETLWDSGWLVFPLVGALLVPLPAGRRLGATFIAIGAANEVAIALRWICRILLELHHATGAAYRVGQWLTWLSGLLFAFSFTFAAGKLLLLFPTGRPPSPRWAPVSRVGTAAVVVVVAAEAVRPGRITDDLPPANPVGLAALRTAVSVAESAVYVVLVGVVVAGLVSLVRRWRRSEEQERRQLAALALAAVGMLGGAAVAAVLALASVPVPTVLGDVLDTALTAAVPAATAVALVRHRLFDVEVALRRSATYVGVSVVVVGVYSLTVVALGNAFEQSSAFGVSLIATGLVAVGFGPLKEAVQGGVDRLLYGDRRSPQRALSRLGERLGDASEPAALLAGVVETVAAALRLPHVVLLVGDRVEVVAVEFGAPRPTTLEIPLAFGGAPVGRLLVAPRAPGERFGAADQRLLADLGAQIAGAVHAVALTNHLRESRERLVLAREEERLRLRRDLHDGLGPSLAAVTLQLDALRRETSGPMPEAWGEAKAEVRDCVAEVRRLVHGLRPPALDELGLVGAVRQQAAALAGPECRVDVQADELPPLPAAVEVAAFRIVAEALTNVARHAGARCCEVRLEHDGHELLLLVRDDGVGVAGMPVRSGPGGVGMSSMRERAEEIGGRLDVDGAPGNGTTVTARIPLPAVAGPVA